VPNSNPQNCTIKSLIFAQWYKNGVLGLLIEKFKSYIKRLVEDELLAKMAASGDVLIKGPK